MQRCKTLFALLALLPVAFAATELHIDAKTPLKDGDLTVKNATFGLTAVIKSNGVAINGACVESTESGCYGKVTCNGIQLCDKLSTEASEIDDKTIPGITVVPAGKDEGLKITWDPTEIEGVMPEKAKLKLCFAKESTADRPWRKFKADVGKNKQCVKKEIDTVPWEKGSKVWTCKSAVPRCKAYIRVFAMNKDGKHTHFSDTDIFQINGYDGLEPGITIGGVIMSILSLAILVGYFTYTITKKQD